jgi:importin-7
VNDNPDGASRSQALLPGDKDLVRNHLVDALLSEREKSVRDLLAETLHSIAVHDFPESWPTLIPKLLDTIRQSDDPNQALAVHNALLALRKVCKRYEYKSKDQRAPLNAIVQQSFPMLLALAQRLSDPNENSLEAAMMLKQIFKIFWSSTQFYLPGGEGNNPSPALSHPEALQPWFDILCFALKKTLPEATSGLEPRGQPTSVEERNAWPWWKVKKWSVQIMSRLFSRYGIPMYAEEEVQEFARHFSQNVATQMLQPVCETLNLRPSGNFCTDRLVYLCLTYVDLAIDLAPTYKLLKPHLDFLLYKVCFPTMCLTQSDIDCFENEPHEFVHRQTSPLADFYDPRMAAINVVTDLVQHRGQDVTQPLLRFLTEILQRYNATPDAEKNHIEKDGALLTFGSLSKYLLSKKKYSGELEGLLISSVFPDFNSSVGFLRYRACWMVQQFSNIQWSDDGTNLRTLIQMVLQRLSDPALPVQIEASKALRFLIESDGAEETLLPVLPLVLTEYFRIMNEIGNDEVVAALQVIIDKFGDHIEPHALALVTQLSSAFDQYCNAGEDEDDDDAAMAAAQCLECIATVLKGLCEKPQLYKVLEPQLIPLTLKILGNDGDYIEYLECALDILTFLTYFPDEIAPGLWQAFPLIYVAFDQWAYDYLNLMVPPMQSFITKDPKTFLQGIAVVPEGAVSYVDLVFSIVAKTVTNDRSSESECRQALSLFLSILHSCNGLVDAYIPMINEIVLGKLGQQASAENPLTRISIYQVIGSALYYNPILELTELEKRGVTQQVFAKWILDAETSMKGKFLPRKLTIIGLSSLLKIPPGNWPVSINASIPSLIAQLVHMTIQLKEDAEAPKEITANDDDAPDATLEVQDEDDGDGGFAEDEDVKNDMDDAYKKALNGSSTWDDDMAKFLLGEYDNDGEDAEEDFSSPLDSVDELLYLSDTLSAAFASAPDFYQQIQSAMPPGSVEAVHRIFAAASAVRGVQDPHVPHGSS